MKLKGLVRFFAIALILICVYQLSFTFIARSYQSTIHDQAEKWVHARLISPIKKYPNNRALQIAYADTLANIVQAKTQFWLDSTKNKNIGPFNLTTYQNAKDKELTLGLDLQGGISVTMEVGIDGLVRALSNYTKDPSFNTALNKAIIEKANNNGNLITLFYNNYLQSNPNKKLTSFLYNEVMEILLQHLPMNKY